MTSGTYFLLLFFSVFKEKKKKKQKDSRLGNVPATAKDVEGFGEHVVVDEASVHREGPHQQNDVPPAKHHVEYLATAEIQWYANQIIFSKLFEHCVFIFSPFYKLRGKVHNFF